ncbi:MAG: 5'-3' exonuclease H3TH domain-containing protein [Intestinimonas sp.]
MTPETFRAEYGFDPIHIIDLKALVGMHSDNIPGVKGVGEKTAMDLIQRYQSVEAIYADLEAVEAKPAVLKKLGEGREQARMSYELATIRCDAPVRFTPEEALRRPVNEPVLYELFLRLEFAKLIDKLGLKGSQGLAHAEKAEAPQVQAELITDPAALAGLLEGVERGRAGLSPGAALLDGVCVLQGSVCPLCLPSGWGRGPYRDFLKTFFSGAVRKVSRDGKDLMHQLLGEGSPRRALSSTRPWRPASWPPPTGAMPWIN